MSQDRASRSASIRKPRSVLLIRGVAFTGLLILLYYLSQYGISDIRRDGMLVALCAVALLTALAASIVAIPRHRAPDEEIAREETFRNEQLLALAGLAAGTARELGTPLTTLSVLVEDLQLTASSPGQQEGCRQLLEQLEHCSGILDKLARTARLKDTGETHWVDLVDYITTLVDQWLVTRSDVTAFVAISGDTEREPPRLEVDFTLGQAIENLLNNAADAWANDIRVEIDWDDQALSVSIIDQGPGFPEELMEQLGRPIIRSDGEGLGLSLLISQATVSRYGGRINFRNIPKGGACATVTLPRQDLD